MVALMVGLPGVVWAKLDSQASVSPAHPLFGDPVTYTVILTPPSGTTVQAPSPQLARQVSGNATFDALGDGRFKYTLTFKVYQTDHMQIPTFSVDVVRDGKHYPHQVKTFDFAVKSRLPKQGPIAFRGLKSPLDISLTALQWTLLLGALMAVLGGGGFGIYKAKLWFKRERFEAEAVPKVAAVSPLDWALEACQKLAAKTWGQEPKQDYSELIDIIKGYLTQKTGQPVLEMTTDEVKYWLIQSPVLDPIKAEIADFLVQGDQVKFAKATPSPEIAKGWFMRLPTLLQTIDTGWPKQDTDVAI